MGPGYDHPLAVGTARRSAVIHGDNLDHEEKGHAAMNEQPSQASGGTEAEVPEVPERSFSMLVGTLPGAPADKPSTAARPTFTATVDEVVPVQAEEVVPEQATDEVVPEQAETDENANEAASVPGNASVTDTLPDAGTPVNPVEPEPSAVVAGEATQALRRPEPVSDDDALLGDAAGLRARWQRVQSDFVDDPQNSVRNAADLVEQTAQALMVALRQRQRQLRATWEGDSASEERKSGTDAPDTEDLRQMMQRYRALFNQLCRS